MRDPLGRQALFAPTPPGRAAGAVNGNGHGKRSLYSVPAPRAAQTVRSDVGPFDFGTATVECSSCGERSRISTLELVARHLPWWLWVPWQRYSNLMSCPACEQRAWLAVTWSL